MRTFALWVFGLFASGIFGSMVGSWFWPSAEYGFFGFIGGMCAFACARLWLGSPKAN
jgi:hypothetical protein